MVTDFCAGTHATEKRCMLLDLHRKLAGCDSKLDILSAAEHDLLLTFASQTLNPSSDITRNKEMRAAAQKLKKIVAAVLARRRAIAWSVPPGPDATQVMLRHFRHFLCALYENYELHEKCRHIPLDMWSLV